MTQEELKAIRDRFVQVMLADDLGPDAQIDAWMALLDEGCEWTLMATGETFRGTDELRRFAEASVAGRKHTKDDHMVFTDAFVGEEHLCVEYTHRGVYTEQGSSTVKQSSAGALAPHEGTLFEMKICIVCHLKESKIDRAHEYFDLGQATSPAGSRPRMFSSR
jgi:ketosteroid isomerase-like protein